MSETASLSTEKLKTLWQDTNQRLKGTERRQFMTQIVDALGLGGQSAAEQELGWNRGTIRQGQCKRKHGPSHDAFAQRGRKPTTLAYHSCTMIPRHCGTANSGRTVVTSQRLYIRLSAGAVRHQLIVQKGYQDAELPTEAVIRQRLNQLGYRL